MDLMFVVDQVYKTEPESAQSIKKAGVKREDVFVTTKSTLT